MKKVFLFLASALMGVAAMATDWELEDGTISVAYNSYGVPTDADGKSVQWQAGNGDVLPEAVEDATGNTAWVPAIGESFVINLKGVSEFTGRVRVFIVDEREAVGYWADMVGSCGEFFVTAGEEFDETVVLQISTIFKTVDDEEVALIVPRLVLACDGAKDEAIRPKDKDGNALKDSQDCEFTSAEYEILYEGALNYESPLTLTYKGVAEVESDGFKYQGQVASAATSAKAGQYVNVELSGVAQNDITTLMYALVDQAEDAYYWTMMSANMVTIASNIKAGDEVSVKFSVALTETSAAATQELYDVFLAEDPAKIMNLYISNMSVKSSVTDDAMYGEVRAGYEINVVSSNSLYGYVTGSGTYHGGKSVTIRAIPNKGYAFKNWSDGSTVNPRTLTVEDDVTMYAFFEAIEYEVSVESGIGGSTTGSGTYAYNTDVTISAIPANFCHFVSWSDGNTENPRTIQVDGDRFLYAVFDYDIIEKDGVTYQFSEGGNLIVIRFDERESLEIPESVVNNEISYPVVSIAIENNDENSKLKTLYIGKNIQEIDDYSFENCPSLVKVYCYATTPPDIEDNTFANMNGYLYVPCDYYEAYDLHAIWGDFKHIECISSEETVLTKDAVSVEPEITEAVFSMPTTSTAKSYRLTITNSGVTFCTLTFNNQGQLTNIDFSENTLKSDIEGYQFTVTGLSAETDYGYNFKALSSTSAVLKEYTGTFTTKTTEGTGGSSAGGEISEGGDEQGGEETEVTYTVSVISANNAQGTVSGSGSYGEGKTATLVAIPTTGYKFVQWNDGNTENPRMVTVSANATYIASFAENSNTEPQSSYTITAIAANNEQGTVVGGGTFASNATTVLAVVPASGYKFVSWNDGNTENPRTVVVTGDTFYIASFEKIATAINEVENELNITISNRQILVNGEAPEYVITILGQKVTNQNLKPGVYFVKANNKQVSVSFQ